MATKPGYTEVRFEIPAEELAIVDGYCSATHKSRTDVLRELIAAFSKDELHKAIVVCRMARINPMASESDRKRRTDDLFNS